MLSGEERMEDKESWSRRKVGVLGMKWRRMVSGEGEIWLVVGGRKDKMETK
jgi:hypothetical protein